MAGGGQLAQQASQAAAARAQYSLAFQISPIILQGGIAASAQGGCLPIIALYGDLALFTGGVADVNAFFAQYLPMPGSTLLQYQSGKYPFANIQVAANAMICEPLTLSMLMIAPVNQPGGYLSKNATWTALQTALNTHNSSGGYFSVATPAFVYNNLLLLGMTDVSHGGSNQQQIMYQLDFEAPLITLEAASSAQSALMSKITGGQQINGTPSWTGNTSSLNPAGLTGLSGALSQFGAGFASTSTTGTGTTNSAGSGSFGGNFQ